MRFLPSFSCDPMVHQIGLIVLLAALLKRLSKSASSTSDSAHAIIIYHDQGDVLVFKIDFYSNHRGEVSTPLFLETLRTSPNRDKQIQYKQSIRILGLLESKGTYIGALTPNILRIEFGNSAPATIAFYISFPRTKLLSFSKLSETYPETPQSEIKRTKAKHTDWLSRYTSSAISHNCYSAAEHSFELCPSPS